VQTINKQTITLDLKKITMIPLPQFIQQDTNTIEFIIKENDAAADFSNIGRIVVNYKRPDKKVISRLLTATGNIVLYELGIDEMEVHGKGEVEIHFFSSDNLTRISTKRFQVHLSESIGTDVIYENSGDLTILKELFVEVEDLIAGTQVAADHAQTQGDYAKAQGDYVTSKKADIDKFTGEQTNLQEQLNQLVIDGDSSPEATQARVDGKGTSYSTLKQRLDVKDAEISVLKADKSYVDALAASLASGSPKGVYATLTELQTAFPTGNTNIYVITGDGKWYYWNGSAWTPGGTYQASGIASGGITQIHIADKAIIPEKTSFLKKSTNLFNKNDVTVDKYITNGGVITDNTLYVLTNYISVKAGVTYTFKHSTYGGVWYTADKQYISGNVFTQAVAPSNAAFFRMGVDKVNLSTQQMNEGSTLLPYEEYYTSLLDVKVKLTDFAQDVTQSLNNVTTERIALNAVTTERIAQNAITPERTSFLNKSTNLFNKKTVTPNKAINNSGVISDSSSYSLSDFIPIKAGQTYIFKHAPWGGIWYTADKQYITGNTTNPQTAPSNAAYFRMGIEKVYVDTQQMNEGTTLQPYQAFGTEFHPDVKMLGDNLVEQSVPITKMNFYKLSTGLNMFNKNDPDTLIGKFVSVDVSSGTPPYHAAIGNNAEYVLSHFIEVEENTAYINTSKSPFITNTFHDANKACIGKKSSSNSFTTIAGTKYIRVNLLLTELDTNMVYKNTGALVEFEPYTPMYELSENIKLNKKNMPAIEQDKLENYSRIYNLSDALTHWENGEKFPVAFMGDSTTDGATTTGNVNNTTSTIGTDHIEPNAYPYLLEQKLKAYTGNSNLRIYNAGFSGWNTKTAVTYFSQIFGTSSAYADVKMIGFVYGINDRILTQEEIEANLKSMCIACYQKGIQPFIVTPQIILQGAAEFKGTVHTANKLVRDICRLLRNFADKYNLELIDMNKATTNFITNAEMTIDSILPDTLHFGDEGHKFEAGFLFSKFLGETIEVTNDTYVSVTNPYTHYAISRGGMLVESGTFKRYAVFNNTSPDTPYVKAEILNSADCKLILTLDAQEGSSIYFNVDGVKRIPSSEVIELEIGHHSIEVCPGTGTAGKYYGFKLTKKRNNV
jgi:hypothetical protein